MSKHRGFIEIVGFAVLIAALVSTCAYLFMLSQDYASLEEQLKQETVQNVQLAKDARAAEADAFRAGLIACGNADVDFLNTEAERWRDLIGPNAMSTMLTKWAKTWAYDDNTLNEMVESYMNEESH